MKSNPCGKVALITGAGGGIGRAIALRLARDGFRIILHGTKESEKLVRRLEREIEKQEQLIAKLDADIEAAAADYQELTRLLGEKEQAENMLMDLMEQWEEAQS